MIIDSSLAKEHAIKQNPDFLCPQDLFDKQILLEVTYFSFDKKLHQGQVVVNKDVKEDILGLFELFRNLHFPIHSVIPIADEKFLWNDDVSCAQNNTSGFNYRKILGTDKISYHAYGHALDINPVQNPFINREGIIAPKGAVYDPREPGAIVEGDEVVKYLTFRGWEWGGSWTDRKDYQHFQKS